MFKWLRNAFRSPKVRVVWDEVGIDKTMKQPNRSMGMGAYIMETVTVKCHYRVDHLVPKEDWPDGGTYMAWEPESYHLSEHHAMARAHNLARFPIHFDKKGIIE